MQMNGNLKLSLSNKAAWQPSFLYLLCMFVTLLPPKLQGTQCASLGNQRRLGQKSKLYFINSSAICLWLIHTGSCKIVKFRNGKYYVNSKAGDTAEPSRVISFYSV